MVFSSTIFLFLFLPVVLALYHGIFFLPITLGSRARIWYRASNLFLLLSSVLFYFWGEQYRVGIFLATTFVDYLAALLIAGILSGDRPQLEAGGSRTIFQRLTLTVSICVNLTLLAYFKYFTFLADSYNSGAGFLGLSTWQLKHVPNVALPIGISFFIFHSMSYTIDVYRGRVKATGSFIDYACYVLMFPQLVAGPIVRYSYVASALVSRVVTAEYFASGIARFVIGLSKKVLIANTVATVADKIFALPADALTPGAAWLGVGAYTIQIYFDFSGYSDMAIGLGRMFGFELPRNFNFPYTASSVREFWRRWHITLSTWFRDYLYIPLGGNEAGNFRTAVNLLIVFFLCGLWHGAKWTFVVWGLYHGFFLILERTGWTDAFKGRTRWLGHLYTILVVMGGWVLFRADTFGQALGMFRVMAGFAAPGAAYGGRAFLALDVVAALVCGVVFSYPIVTAIDLWLSSYAERQHAATRGPFIAVLSTVRVGGLAAGMFLCALQLASGTHNPFIYFRF